MRLSTLHDDSSDVTLGASEVEVDAKKTPIPQSAIISPESEIRETHNDLVFQRRLQVGPRNDTKSIALVRGNLILESPVPTTLLEKYDSQDEPEFRFIRYSAATCDPDKFNGSEFTLRQANYKPPRRTELFIVITMYNEEAELLCGTMEGVMKNIAHLCKYDRSKTWGKEGWKKVVVCIVADGRHKIKSRALNVIAALGAYQDGIAKVRLSADATLYA